MYLRAVICFHLYGRFAMMKNRKENKRRKSYKTRITIITKTKMISGHQA